MPSSRRAFLKCLSGVGGAGIAGTSCSRQEYDFIGVNPFIEAHPEAVFIMRTDADVKTNHEALRAAGHDFTRSVFVRRPEGVPPESVLNLIPNLTNVRWNDEPRHDHEYRMGIVTDPWFIEGMIDSYAASGVSAGRIHLSETWNLGNWGPMGYTDMAERAGVRMNETQEIKVHDLPPEQVQWVDVPDGGWFRRIPYIAPVNAPGSWLVNVAKFKAHGMGLTLCCKNLQGTICHDYQLLCSEPKGEPAHFNPRREAEIEESYARHVADGIPRWDKEKDGLRMEKWVARTLDNLLATPSVLHVVEGVYGRDGDGFIYGPNPAGNDDNPKGEAWDYMTNIVIFGRDPFRVDIVGHWLGGHEPGNLGLFHLAVERGMSNVIDPMDIPVYEWKNGKAVLAELTSFERHPLKTRYIQRNDNGGEEPYFHMLDQPFDYSRVRLSRSDLPVTPSIGMSAYAVGGAREAVSCDYAVPGDGHARVELLDSAFRTVDVPADRYHLRGHHQTVFDRGGDARYCRFRWKGYDRVVAV